MTPQEKIAKLEGLLVRVKERSDGRRPNGAVAFAPKSATQEVHTATTAVIEDSVVEEAALDLPTTPPGADVFVPEPIEASTRIAAKPIAMSLPPEPDTSGWSDPPPPETTSGPDTTIVSHAAIDDSDVDVEVSTEVVEIDIDEPGLAPVEHGFVPAESGAQPVAEHVRGEDERLPEDLHEELATTATSLPEPLDASAAPPPPANEIIEPEPSSSPRPIASEAADVYASADSAYEEESAPRHTPPPESGKQVAAPSVRPEPLRKPSLPPEPIAPSFGGTSGWREPGISLPREPSRVPPAATTSYPSSIPPEAATIAPAAPEITRAALPADANVVTIEAAAASFSPATFGELLDATLSL